MKRIIIVISIIIIMFQFYIGFPTGKKTLNVKFIDSSHTSAPNFKAGSNTGYYIDVTLESGQKVRVQSTNRLLLGFTGGNFYEVESYYSVLRLKTIYVLK